MPGLVLAQATPPPALPPAPIFGCPALPPDHIWNTPIDHLPVQADSAAIVASIGTSTRAHPDFGAGSWLGAPIGIPFVAVPGDQPRVPISFHYAAESDPGPYPIPTDAPIEGGPDAGGDRHVIVVDKDTCTLYELYAAYPQPEGGWRAGSGALFDLGEYALRPAGWTSADAAGLPILPGLARYEEVAAGHVRHALRMTAPRTRRAYVWPARHFASDLTDPSLPPMGQRFRLKADYDASLASPQGRVLIDAMKRYGLILADNGSPWYVTGAPHPDWDDAGLRRDFRNLSGADFEAVDATALMLDPDSGQARQSEVAPSPSATSPTSTETPAPPPTTDGRLFLPLTFGHSGARATRPRLHPLPLGQSCGEPVTGLGQYLNGQLIRVVARRQVH